MNIDWNKIIKENLERIENIDTNVLTTEQSITVEDIKKLKKLLEPRYVVLTPDEELYFALVKEFGQECVQLTKITDKTILVDMWNVREIQFKR